MKKDLTFLYLAWVVACIASLGSIALGELSNNLPCILCWIQRLCMFPLAYILGVAFIKKNALILPYVVLMPALGLMLSIYHIAVQEIPSLDPVRICGMGPTCTLKHDIGLQFITMPMLGFIAFSWILIFLCLSYKNAKSRLGC